MLDSSIKPIFEGLEIKMWTVKNIGHMFSQLAAVDSTWQKNSLLAVVAVATNIF